MSGVRLDVEPTYQQVWETVCSHLRDAVLSGDLAAGTKLVEAKLAAEQRAHPGSRAVFFDSAAVKRVAHQIEIGLHGLAILFA